jgi:hypothetical protein
MVAGSVIGAFDPSGGGVNIAQAAFTAYGARLMWTKISGLFEEMGNETWYGRETATIRFVVFLDCREKGGAARFT